MAKLVVLSAGLTGKTQELKVDKVTIGRVEDNTFQIAEPSVSSHHCEVLMRGADVVIHDLDSTNGTFINGEKITEKVLKIGEILRLGQIEMRLEGDAPPPPSKKVDQTMVMQRGVNLTELEQGARGGGFDTKGTGFSKKSDKVNKIFIIVGAILGVVILALLAWVFLSIKKTP
jgi:pSer/pThr/pTyr-binding forkhead associated (FHA) protein